MIDLMPSLGYYAEEGFFKKIRPFHKNRAVNLHTFMKNRPERLISFLVVWLTMFSCIWGSAQIPYTQDPKREFLHPPYPGQSVARVCQDFDVMQPVGVGSGLQMTIFSGSLDRELIPRSSDMMPNLTDGKYAPSIGFYSQPADLYYMQSGFFCKREWELEKTTHIPFRFRLGSLADCNAMEGKH
jgi:hypothetical protein